MTLTQDRSSSDPSNRLLLVRGKARPFRDLVIRHLARHGWAIWQQGTQGDEDCRQALRQGKNVVVDFEIAKLELPHVNWASMCKACNAKAIVLTVDSASKSKKRRLSMSDGLSKNDFDEVLEARSWTSLNKLLPKLICLLPIQQQHSAQKRVGASMQGFEELIKEQAVQDTEVEAKPSQNSSANHEGSVGRRHTRRIYETGLRGGTDGASSNFKGEPGAINGNTPYQEGNPPQEQRRGHHAVEAGSMSWQLFEPKREQSSDAGLCLAQERRETRALTRTERRHERNKKKEKALAVLKCKKKISKKKGKKTKRQTQGLDLKLGNSLPIILFDLNGTLTSHTAMRRSAGVNLMRPGIPHLRRLLGSFNLGIYTSSSLGTVTEAKAMIEKAAGPGPLLFKHSSLVLYRVHTLEAPLHHRMNGGKEWDTVKPLDRYFSKLDRVLLIDDDAFKACEGEQANMVLMPRWEEEPHDDCICQLVDAILSATDGCDQSTDLRLYSNSITASLSKAALVQ